MCLVCYVPNSKVALSPPLSLAPSLPSLSQPPLLPVDEGDDEVLLSGWGEVDDMREDLFKDWGDLLEKWDGKDKSRPKQLVKLCRKVCMMEWESSHIQPMCSPVH